MFVRMDLYSTKFAKFLETRLFRVQIERPRNFQCCICFIWVAQSAYKGLTQGHFIISAR